ncbi:MAG: two-component regulator propeller domain-containing protein [Bacteroidota bacterium]
MKITIVSYFFFFTLCSAQTSNFVARQWGVEEGLPQSSVNSIIQTRDGYIWLATFGGLVRFDGIGFDVFNSNTSGIKSERILVLYEDRRGALWFGTEGGGVGRMFQGKVSTFGIAEGLPGEVVTSLVEDSAGTLWVGTMDGGVGMIVNESASTAAFNKRLPDHAIKSILTAGHGSLWICTEVLVHVVGTSVTIYKPVYDIPGSQVNAVKEDSQGKLWIGTDKGLVQFVNGRFEVVTPARGKPPENIWRIMEDRQGTLWLSSSNGLYQYDKQVVDYYGKSDGLIDLTVKSVFEDREGSLWVGTNAGGLHQFKHRAFQTVSARDGLPVENITSMAEGSDGKVWIGLQCGGVSVWENGRVTDMVGTVMKNYGCVWSVYEDSKGSLWIGVWDGFLQRWRNGIIEQFSEKDGLQSKIVLSIYEDRDQTLWFGTVDKGLVKFDGKRFRHFTTADGLSHNDVRSIYRDRKGSLWAGTSKGLNKYDGKTFTTYTSANGFVDAPVRVIYEDSDGVLWFGTYGGGLIRYAEGTFTSFTTNEGLFDNIVSQILEDDNGNFWMGCNRGIFRIARSELNAVALGKLRRVQCSWYDASDGLRERETNGGFQPAGLKTRDGLLWFPTVKGVTIINPSSIKINNSPPPVVIKTVSVDGMQLNTRDTVVLSYDHKRIQFHVAALSYRAPQKNRFRFILEGFDEQWSNTDQARTISYTTLPPGKYTFRVRASNDDGIWNMEGASLTIVIMPPFWGTWWFRALFVLFFLTVGPAIYFLRVRQLTREKEKQIEFSLRLIESQESERKRIANELHDGLGQNLLLIKNKLLVTLQSQNKENTTAEQIEEASNIVSSTIEEVRSISHNLRPHQLDQLGITKTLRSIVRQMQESTSIEFASEIHDIDGALSPEEEINLFRIVQESFNNILKHSRATKVSVSVVRKKNVISIEVLDNGKGIAHRNAGESENLVSPAGFGISGMQERAKMFGWELEIDSLPDQGTKLSLNIPNIFS